MKQARQLAGLFLVCSIICAANADAPDRRGRASEPTANALSA